MSSHSRRASATDSQVEGHYPYLSDDLNISSPNQGAPGSTQATSFQRQDSQISPGGKDQITPPPKNKENKLNGDAPAVEESEEARMERLGRQRPEVFGSIWSEIGFVFSISMSQVLTVGNVLPYPGSVLTEIGILCLWIYSDPSNSCYEASYPCCVVDVACECFLVDCRVVSPSLRSTGRHVWRVPSLCRWVHVAYHMELGCWILH